MTSLVCVPLDTSAIAVTVCPVWRLFAEKRVMEVASRPWLSSHAPEDVFSLFPCQAHPSQSVTLSAEAFADLEIFGRGHAIINEWFRAWIEPAVQDIQAPVRGDAVTFQRTAELLNFMQQFLQFRTVALRKLAATQADIEHFRACEAALLDRIGSYWAVFYHLLERATLPIPCALDMTFRQSMKTQTEYRNSLVAEWLFDAGLDLEATKSVFDRDAFQDLKRKISRHYSTDRTVGGWDKRRFWFIFSTGLTKFITMGERYWNYLVGFDGWAARFTLFNRALMHEGPLEAVIPSLRCIHDPITLGGAFAVGAGHKSNELSKEVRSQCLGRTMVLIIAHSLRALSDGLNSCAVQAVSAFFAMSRPGLFGSL